MHCSQDGGQVAGVKGIEREGRVRWQRQSDFETVENLALLMIRYDFSSYRIVSGGERLFAHAKMIIFDRRGAWVM